MEGGGGSTSEFVGNVFLACLYYRRGRVQKEKAKMGLNELDILWTTSKGKVDRLQMRRGAIRLLFLQNEEK